MLFMLPGGGGGSRLAVGVVCVLVLHTCVGTAITFSQRETRCLAYEVPCGGDVASGIQPWESCRYVPTQRLWR
jgi:hypothetical protein